MSFTTPVRLQSRLAALLYFFPLCATAGLYHSFIGTYQLFIHDDYMNIYLELSPAEFGGSTEFISAKKGCDCITGNVYQGEIKTNKGVFKLNVKENRHYTIQALPNCRQNAQ